MNWAESFCIVGCFASVAYIAGCYTNYKKYHIDILVESVDKLEKDFKKFKADRHE